MKLTGTIQTFMALAVVTATALPPANAAELWETLSAPQPTPEATLSGYANVNGAQIYFATYGTGAPLILLHGGLGNTDYWGGQIDAFAKDHTVITIASRGHGRSSNNGQPYSYSLMASDVLAVMDAMGVAQAPIVGWSDGGNIGLDIAINNPDRLTSLFAFGANFNPSGVKASVDTNETFGAYVGLSAEYYTKLSKTPDGFDTFVGELVNMWAEQPNFTAEQLGAIPVPIAIADGDHDEAIDMAHTQQMAEMIPGAELIILPGLSHFAMWQDPATFNAAVLKFLAAN